MANEFDGDSDPTGRVMRRRMDGVEEDSHEMTGEIRKLREDMIEGFTDLRGRNGDNGKIGEMRRSLDEINRRSWWVLTFIIGCIGGIAIKVFLAGVEYGSIKASLNRLDEKQTELIQRVKLLELKQ